MLFQFARHLRPCFYAEELGDLPDHVGIVPVARAAQVHLAHDGHRARPAPGPLPAAVAVFAGGGHRVLAFCRSNCSLSKGITVAAASERPRTGGLFAATLFFWKCLASRAY